MNYSLFRWSHSTALAFALTAPLLGLGACGGSTSNTPASSPEPTTVTGGSTEGPRSDAPTMPPAPEMTNTGPMPMGGPTRTAPPRDTSAPVTMGTAGDAKTDRAPPAAGMTDEQIAAVTNAANSGEVDQAKEAVQKARSAKVKQFAQHMIADHGAAFKQQNDILRNANLTASDNPTSRQIQSDGKQIMASLHSATGADFDRQYIDAQVKEHQEVLDTLDNKLIPDAKNAELKSFLQTVRGKVADHLKMAKDIQASLK